ncbi:MAG: PAC2 family protein [Candidatus Lambdaproteobacteria bacterium]|nr:PAC2 family protein [Candidatus Lambdaproteobacteria bacterium]
MNGELNALQVDFLPKLRRPLLIAAFEGWNDGGQAATNSVRKLIKEYGAKKFARIDPEEFFVFSENRPTVRWVDGRTRRLSWQKNDFYYAELPEAERDLVLLRGTEPNLKWRTFCNNVITLAHQVEASFMVTLGGFLADVLYTRPVQVNGSSSDLELEEKYGLTRSNYEGPTGIVGVLSNQLQAQRIPTASLWAAVPYYISIPNPKAVYALLSKVNQVFSLSVNLDALQKQADEFDNEINDVVAKDPNVAAYVRELKKREFLN